MNKKEVLEIRKQFTPANCAITRIAGCYVDHEKNKKMESKSAFLSLPEEEAFKYFDIFKKTLSGTMGKNMLNMEFPIDQEMPGGTQEFLMKLKASKLEDDMLLEEFYDKVIATYEYAENYYIILIHAMYDVPGRSSDNLEMFDASDEVYEYLVCSICPVSLSKAGLSYNAESNCIQDRIRDWVVDMPDKGFLFPAFNDRSTDIHGVLYYTKKSEDLQPELIEQLLGARMPMSANTQKETFQMLIEDTLGEDWDPASVTNMDDFEALLKKLVDNGMESPVALNQEDWSNAGHYFTQVYEEQDGTLTGTEKIMEDLRNGSVDLMSNERFTSLMDTYDLLMEYNINKADPLAADYDENAADLAEGDVAFWFNGNWAWAEISDYIEDDTEIGIMPVPQNGTEENANVNDYICGGATKQVMIDKECNDEKQQAAAKDFLDWLANTAEGNKVLVDDCSLVPAFSNITEEATNMLGQSIQRYTVEGKLFDQPSNYPGDHWSEVGAIMQKYLDKQIDRAEFAKEVQDYWTNLSE